MATRKEHDKWQYNIIKCYNMLDSLKELNEEGDNGWEFCYYDRHACQILLKRRR